MVVLVGKAVASNLIGKSSVGGALESSREREKARNQAKVRKYYSLASLVGMTEYDGNRNMNTAQDFVWCLGGRRGEAASSQ